MRRRSQIHFIRKAQRLLWSARGRATAALLALLFVVPVAALAQGSPFDTGFNAIQSLFTGTIAKVASLVAIVIGGYGFAHGEPGAKKALAGVAAGTGIGQNYISVAIVSPSGAIKHSPFISSIATCNAP
jgi:type IV secretion system protein VirB2